MSFTKTIIAFVICSCFHLKINSQRIYYNDSSDNFIVTNTKYFILPNTASNQILSDSLKDFYSNMRLSTLISKVAKTGVQITEDNIRISRENFAIVNTGPFGSFIQNLRMVIIEPLAPGNDLKPAVLATIGGANAGSSEIAFLTGICQYVMKGYVVAYFENPNVNTVDQGIYLLNKGVSDNNNEVYLASTYLGYQVATAAAKFLAFNANKYNIDPTKFFLMGQSYGAFMCINLGLGDPNNYYESNGSLKQPFNKLGIPDRFLNNQMRNSNFKIQAVSLWAIGYPFESNEYYNPYGNFIDSGDPAVIHFHGLFDEEVSYKTDWFNYTPYKSLYGFGPTDVAGNFNDKLVKYKAFINCRGTHSVFDIGMHPPIPRNMITDYIENIDFNNANLFAQQNEELYKLTKYIFDQGTNIVDLTSLHFQNQLPTSLQESVYFLITKKEGIDGNFKLSDCYPVGFCKELNNFINSSCNDEDPCTINDKINAQCSCAGTFADEDNDGTCDAMDLCNQGPEPGTPCNDDNVETSNDIITSNCICEGITNVADINYFKVVVFPNPFYQCLYFQDIEIVEVKIIHPMIKNITIDFTNKCLTGFPETTNYCILELRLKNNLIKYIKVVQFKN